MKYIIKLTSFGRLNKFTQVTVTISFNLELNNFNKNISILVVGKMSYFTRPKVLNTLNAKILTLDNESVKRKSKSSDDDKKIASNRENKN